MKKLLNISLSAVCAEGLALAAGTNETVQLARIYGEASDVKSNGKGADTIMGDFRAVNLQTGEEFASSVLYLPRGLHETIVLAVMNNPNSGIRFGYDIWADPEPQRKSYNIGFNDLTDDGSRPDPLANFAKGLPPVPGKAPEAAAKK